MPDSRPIEDVVDPAAERLAPLLERLVNYERTRPDKCLWNLANMRELLARPGAGQKLAPAVQVGGSKGKGTTCGFLFELAQARGLRTGVYLSPHVETLLERIRIGGELVGLDDLEGALAAILRHADARGFAPTFFEAMTAAAVDVFAAAQVGLCIYEVGLGGRFDATTAVPVDVSVITGIELEHTELLGDTLAQIATEKAHVMRPGGVAFTGAGGEALAAIEQHALAIGCKLFVLGRDFLWREQHWQGTTFHGRLLMPDGRLLPARIDDARNFEPAALALAAAAFARLFPDAELQLDPAPRPQLPGRFEVLPGPGGHPVILDGAHTETSLQAVANELQRRWPGQPVAVLFGSASGKRWREGLRSLLPHADSVLVTELSGTASEDPATILRWLSDRGQRCELVANAVAGCERLLAFPGPRLVVGSFYLAGQVRRWLRAQPPAQP